MKLRFYPGEEIRIKSPNITGRISEIHIFDNYAIMYVVRWWCEGELHSDNFVESELEHTQPHEEIKIGFGK